MSQVEADQEKAHTGQEVISNDDYITARSEWGTLNTLAFKYLGIKIEEFRETPPLKPFEIPTQPYKNMDKLVSVSPSTGYDNDSEVIARAKRLEDFINNSPYIRNSIHKMMEGKCYFGSNGDDEI